MNAFFFGRGRVFLFLLISVFILGVVPSGAEPPSPPPYYAITHVKVVSGAGAPVEDATVLLANGLIEAVGKNLTIPGDARVIEGKGLTLFPGMIDALTNLAQKKDDSSSSSGEGRPRGPVITGPEDRPQTTPFLSASDALADDARIEKWRKAGFTAAVTSPEKGIFAGQAALINLEDDPGRESVVLTPAAQRLNFDNSDSFNSFPGSLMGVL